MLRPPLDRVVVVYPLTRPKIPWIALPLSARTLRVNRQFLFRWCVVRYDQGRDGNFPQTCTATGVPAVYVTTRKAIMSVGGGIGAV